MLWIDESPRQRGWLAVGTDDGLIQITQDGGTTWRQAAPIPGVPDRAQIRRVFHSAHDDRTLYAAASAHEDDDFRPMVAKSLDHGRTWTRIEANLPAGQPVLSLVEDPVNPRLLFAGTQFGIYATLDAGSRWFSLGLNLPTNAVHDMVIQPREGDLVIGTHGRGIWVLDSLAGLRGLTPETLAAAGTIFTPRPAFQLTRFDRGRSAFGSAFFTAPNPPDGVYLDVYLNPSRTDAATLEIADSAGRVIRRLSAPAERGLQRIIWDMRGDAPAAGGPAAPGAGRGRGGAPALVAPGTYEARLTIGDITTRVPVVIRPDPGHQR